MVSEALAHYKGQLWSSMVTEMNGLNDNSFIKYKIITLTRK